VAAGLKFGVFPDNGRPLHGVCGDIGGAAELIASASAGRYLGVRSTARCAAGRIERWEDRYAFAKGEEEAIRAAGMDPLHVYTIEELVPGIDAHDGLFVTSAITDNAHIPLLNGVLWGSNFAEVAVLAVGASGAADIYRLSLAFPGYFREAAGRLQPVLDDLLGKPGGEMAEAIDRALASPAGSRRLKHEVATTYYRHFTESGGRIRLDMKSVEASESQDSLSVLRALVTAAPDWLG